MSPSRREFVASLGAAAVVGPRLVAAADPQKSPPMPGYIDAHVHVWTPDVKAFPTAVGWDKSTVKPDSFTPEELLARAKPCGVGRIVLIQMSFYRFDNRYMLVAMRRFPGV